MPSSWGSLDRVQVYVIEGDPLTLIDTGVRTDASRSVLEGSLEELGYGLAEIGRVVVTHAHRDHMGLVQTLREAGAELECCVHEADADRVERYAEETRERFDATLDLFREYGVPEPRLEVISASREEHLESRLAEGEATVVDRRLREGDRVGFKHFDLRVHHSPGHTPGHLLLEDEELGLLFTGDQVMGQAIPNTENFYSAPLPEPAEPLRRRPRFEGLRALRSSLRALRGRRFRRLLPAYGGILQRPDRAIHDTLLYYDVRLQRIERGLKHLAALDQDVTAFELWKALFREDESIDDMRTHLLTLIGALDCLEVDGLVVAERRADGVLTFHHG